MLDKKFRGSRRDLLKFAGATALAGVVVERGLAGVRGEIVVVGGGFGGATCARYLRRLAPDLSVTLVEREARFVTCPFSNTVIGGLWDLDSISHDFEGLRGHGVRVVRDEVVAIDPDRSSVRLSGGDSLAYDRLVLSPGIDFNWDGIAGYDQTAADRMPHAWKAGPRRTCSERNWNPWTTVVSWSSRCRQIRFAARRVLTSGRA